VTESARDRDVSERGPYASQHELIEDQLAAMRQRLRAARAHLDASLTGERAPRPWPSDLLGREEGIELRVLASSEDVLPIARLHDRFALTLTEQRVLWLLIAHELCPVARKLVRELAMEAGADPTTDVVRRVVYGPAGGTALWRELGPHGVLPRFGLIERLDASVEVPEYRQSWKLGRRVLALLHGDLGLDPALADLAVIEGEGPRLDELELAGAAARELEAAFDRAGLVLAYGPVGTGRRSSLVAIARARGFSVLRIDGRELARDRALARRQLRAIARECQLLGLVPLVRDLDALDVTGDVQDRIDLVEQELPALVLATSSRRIARRWKRAPVAVELAPLGAARRAALWRRAIPAAGPGDAEILARTYPLAPALIEAAGRIAVERCGAGPMRPAHIEQALRAVLDHRFAGLATRVHVTQTWDDLVLPEEQTTAMIELLARIRERARVYEDWGFADKLGRGLGITALFSGPPGTGKTMAAGLIAKSLGTELYQVDLSKVVSKWIGETEKNLAAVFDAAESGHAVLLFDEADALFGKRTEIRSSNDRHANQEINFLLQRLESYAGICILTTNHATAIDEAFRRRIAVHVTFPMPEAEERERLWKVLIPERAPTSGDLRIAQLAETYVLSGGYIRNAVLRAAFLAADERVPIDAARLARAAQLEYEALGKLTSSSALDGPVR